MRLVLGCMAIVDYIPYFFTDEKTTLHDMVAGTRVVVRAADGTSSNLVEADDGVSDADFLNKIATALKEAKESRVELVKLRLGNLQNYAKTAALDLESEATPLSAIYASIIRNMELKLEL